MLMFNVNVNVNRVFSISFQTLRARDTDGMRRET